MIFLLSGDRAAATERAESRDNRRRKPDGVVMPADLAAWKSLVAWPGRRKQAESRQPSCSHLASEFGCATVEVQHADFGANANMETLAEP
jgi:hypothetical protein